MTRLASIYHLSRNRSEKMVTRIEPFLQDSQRIIDIGSGPGYITHILREKGKTVEPVDIANKSFLSHIQPTIYNGKKLPFADNSFDTALLITVLHHAQYPETVFKEAGRVAKEIIIIETSYKYCLQKPFIVLHDTLANGQLFFYWRSYRTDQSWRSLFKQEGYKVAFSQEYLDKQQGAVYIHPLYFLKKD